MGFFGGERLWVGWFGGGGFDVVVVVDGCGVGWSGDGDDGPFILFCSRMHHNIDPPPTVVRASCIPK